MLIADDGNTRLDADTLSGVATRPLAERRAEPIPLPPLPNRPLVSVLMANYNYAGYVGEAVESVLRQTYDHFELFVCDDGSSDGSPEVVESYARRDPRVRLVRRAENGGMASAWNAAYPLSAGQIICMLDADDVYELGKLRAVVDHFCQRPEDGLLIHPMLVIDGQGREIQRIPCLTQFEEGWIADRVVRRGGRWRYMPTSALCFRREAAEYVFPIPQQTFRRTADGFIFTLLPMLTRVGVVREVLTRYRVHGRNGMTSSEFDFATAKRLVDARQRVTGGVNGRLAELGLHGCQIEASRNINYLEHDLSLNLLRAEPRRNLVRQYAALCRALRADDLYGRSQKAMGFVVYGLAILLPAKLRASWLTGTLRHNKAKDRLRRIMGWLGARGRRATAPPLVAGNIPLAANPREGATADTAAT